MPVLSNTALYIPQLDPLPQSRIQKKGKSIKKCQKLLYKVNMDIVFCDCLSLGGDIYDFLLVGMATRYWRLYVIPSLSSAYITSDLEAFKSYSGQLIFCFHSNFDKNIISNKSLRWIMANNSNIISDPAGRQYSNGLEECTWSTLIKMARAYITGK